MDVVISSPVGLAGSVQLLGKSWEVLLERYTKRYLQNAGNKMQELMRDADRKIEGSFTYRESDGSSGIYGMLWRLAEQAGVGLRIELKKIPILQETVEICNTLDIDPYRIESIGALLFCENGAVTAENLRASGFRYAAVIGKTANDKKRLLLYDDIERYLTKPQKHGEIINDR